MMQFAVVHQATQEIKGLVSAQERDALPFDDGNDYREVTPALPGFPDAPFERAVWKWGESGPYWHDPRTLQERVDQALARCEALLASTNAAVMLAFETGTPVPANVAAFRAAVRAVPSQAGFPDNVDWPELPTP